MSEQRAGWEQFPHDADIGIRGFGPTIEAAFEQAALALMHIVTDVARVEPREAVPITCEAPDQEVLLVDWLNALIFEMATRSMLFARFEVRIEEGHLTATAWGEPIDPTRHRLGVEVKGATFTALRVARREDGIWLAQCVVDV